MRRMILIGWAALVAALPAGAELDTAWTRTFGGTSNDGFRALAMTDDGGYLLAGYTYSLGSGDVDMWAVRTDGDGTTIWERTFGGAGRDYAFGACATTDGGFAIVGYTTSRGAGGSDVFLVRIDGAGDTLWTRTYGGSAADDGRSVCEAPDGSLIVAGQTESYGAGQADFYILRVDTAGDTIWTRTHGDSLLDFARGICMTPDGNVGVAGSILYNSGNLDLYLAEWDMNGDVVWSILFADTGPINFEWATSVHADPDSGLVILGYRGLEGTDVSDICIGKASDTGQSVFWRRYADDYYVYGDAFCPTYDGGYLICGADKSVATQRNDLLLIKRMPGSGWVDEQTLGGPGSDWASAIAETRPGVYVVAGHTDSYGAGGLDGWLVLFRDPEVFVPSGGPDGRLHLSPPAPSPASSSLCFSVTLPEAGFVDVRVVNVAGRLVRTLSAGETIVGTRRYEWDGRDERGEEVPSGVYFVVAGGPVREMRRAVVVR
ncbi:MAG: hypothetical protein EHM19_05380 [Candidatus Latescibacterota bacterium]|nr:MAG: hypothetical protein EHM19_05380 [Candidatus Latescibacterota bacterium]